MATFETFLIIVFIPFDAGTISFAGRVRTTYTLPLRGTATGAAIGGDAVT